MVLFYILSLLLTLITLNYYIASKVETSIHRLLPMTVGLIAVFEICQVARLITQADESFAVLEDMMVLEMLYLLTHYVLEFYYIRLSKKTGVMLQVALLFMAFVALFQYENRTLYLIIYRPFIMIYLFLILAAATYIYKKNHFSQKERQVVNMLFAILVIAVIALMFRNATFVYGRVMITCAFNVVCLVAFYLMKTDRLVDNATRMHTNLFEAAEVAIALFDVDFYILEINEEAKKIFPEHLSFGKRDKQDKEFRDSIKAFAQAEERTIEVERLGNFFRCTIEEYVFQDEICGYIMTIVDITKQKLEVKRFEELKQEAEAQSLSKSKFLASMSHDLRSPLHAIIGASDVLFSKNNLTAMHRSYIQMIRNSSKVLLGLVNDILLHSKLEAGKLVLSKNPYSIEQMLKDLSQMMIMNLQAKPVDFQLNFNSKYPAEVLGDQMRVREIVQNIISNAVKFTEEGMICCNVTCEEEVGTNRVCFVCEIRDTGPGMSKEQLSVLFDEYTSFAGQRKKDGTGLGMSIVRQLVTLMDGNVRAESDGATGSTIFVTFYQELTKDEWCEPVQFSQKELMRRTVKLEQLDLPKVRFMDARVLVVDDIEVNQTVFKQVVQRWGIEADSAGSGAEAIEMAKRKDYHLIFLDLMMPLMDGMETAAEIRKFSNTPLILLTADASDETKKKSIQAGFVDYMGKPIDTKQLERNLEKHIPSAFRVSVETPTGQDVQLLSEQNMQQEIEANRTILKTVVAELEQIYEKLPEYFETDLAMFRIKVHGVKGLTRQIYKLSMSRQAEIMEMAAKTDNRRFIEENMEDFLMEIKETLEEVKEELAALPEKQVEKTKDSVEELLKRLWEAFDDFDLKAAEQCVEQLKVRDLSDTERVLVEKLAAACDDIDYEEGCRILEEYEQGR